MVWGIWGGLFLGDPSGPSKHKKRSHAAWRSFFFRRSAPMHRGAHFVIFDVPFGAPCWAQRGRQKRYKINVFFFILKMNGALGAATKWIPKKKNSKIHKKNECLYIIFTII